MAKNLHSEEEKIFQYMQISINLRPQPVITELENERRTEYDYMTDLITFIETESDKDPVATQMGLGNGNDGLVPGDYSQLHNWILAMCGLFRDEKVVVATGLREWVLISPTQTL